MDAEIRDYLDHLVLDRERAPNTTDRYAALLRRFAAFVRRDLGRPAVAPGDVDRRLAELFVRHGGRAESAAHSAASTRNVRLAALRGFFGHLVVTNHLDRDPTVGLLSAKVKPNSPGFVTESEFEHLRATVGTHASEHYASRDVALITTLFNCGLRISEALSLDLTQADFDGLRFRSVMRKGRIREDVVMNRAVADALRRWLVYRPGYRNAADSPAIFLSDRGRRLSPRAFQRSFRRYVDLAGFGHRRLTPHGLRHSCATALIRKGVGIETVADVLAHRRLDTTRIYLHLGSQRKLEAVALLGNDRKVPKPRNPRLTAPITPGTIGSGSAGKDASRAYPGSLRRTEDSDMRRAGILVGLACGATLTVGCGPTISTQLRVESVRAPGNSGTISKDGLIVEVPELKEVPPQILVHVTACNGGQQITDPLGNPAFKDVAAVVPGSELYQLRISNQTDHVIRLQGAVIRLFDPAENQIEPVSKEDAAGAAMRTLTERGVCPQDFMKVQGALAPVKFIGPNTELLPGTTTAGYLVFMPPKADLVGVWRLSLYEVPVAVDAAGAAVTRTRFDFPYVRRKYEDTFSQELIGERKFVSTREVP